MRSFRSWPMIAACVAAAYPLSCQNATAQIIPHVDRLEGNPIITASMLPDDDGENINGPSLIRVPDWVPDPLGRYYLYFAHHEGQYIRMAYADELTGPWRIYEGGTLRVEQTRCGSLPRPEMVPYVHVASPDVHVDDDARQIRMYFHCNVFIGGDPDDRMRYPQQSLVATSPDGLRFEARDEALGLPYFRAFRWAGAVYALAMPGVLYRSSDGLTDFEEGPTLFTPAMRHSAVAVRDGRLSVFYTVVGEDPERILLSEIELGPDWMSWEETAPAVVLEPETDWEGGSLPREPSSRGSILRPVRQLRDPALFLEDGETYLLYSVAGEQAIGITRLHWD